METKIIRIGNCSVCPYLWKALLKFMCMFNGVTIPEANADLYRDSYCPVPRKEKFLVILTWQR